MACDFRWSVHPFTHKTAEIRDSEGYAVGYVSRVGRWVDDGSPRIDPCLEPGEIDRAQSITDAQWQSLLSGCAAAPDLLEAARLANLELLAMGQGSSASPALRALWSAIAKAEGRTE